MAYNENSLQSKVERVQNVMRSLTTFKQYFVFDM
jgi:hypothetical protein